MRLIYIALGWTAGILLAANNISASPTVTLIWLGLVGAAVIAAWLAWPDDGLRWIMIALIAFTLGGLRMSLVPRSSEVARFNNSGGLTIEGTIVDEPDVRDDQTQIRVAAESLTRAGETILTSGLVLVRAPISANVRFGDRVTATGLLIPPAEFDTFSYADFLGRSGVFSIMQDAAIEVLERNPADKFRATLYEFKAQAAQHIGRSLPEPQAGLLTGILLGNDNGISPEVAEAFSRVGASHIVAISGFNMVILSGAIMGLLGRLRMPERRAAVIGIGIILIYSLLVGAGAAVVRAALMSSLLVIGTAFRRKTYVPASLAFVALCLSVLNPTVLWDIGFQLSFFATLGLALFADPLAKRFDALLNHLLPPSLARSVSGFLAEPLIVTLAVQITTLPLIALYFSRLSLVVVLSNLLIVPVQSAVLILGIVATLIAFVLPALAQILYWYDLVLLSWTTTVVRLLARLPFADIEFHVDPRLVALFFMILIGGALMQATQPTWAQRLSRFIRQRAIASATLFGGFATVCLIGAVFVSRPDGKLHLWLLDAGHSNAVLMQTPGGAQILIDGGRFPSRLLTSLGDRLPFNDQEIEVLVITQPDENEYAALPALLNRYEVGVVLTNGHPNMSPAFAALQDQLTRHAVHTVTAGYTLEADDGVTLEVLHPQVQPELSDSLDDQALVLRVRYGELSFLLTSDLSFASQRALLDSGQWPLASVLQLPQHGRVRSLNEDFLAAVQPQLVILQSDPTNRLGDPNPDTLALLGDVPLLRTDQQGTIHLWTDGRELWTANN
jgi:competence protein ComEC